MGATRRVRSEAGMTLVEVVVAMGILSIVLTTFLSALASATKTTRPLQKEAQAVDELRVALASIGRELRSAECVNQPAANAAASSVLRFTTHSNAVPGGYEVTYTANTSGQLWRQVTGEPAVRVVTSALVDTGDAFSHIATPRRTLRIHFHVQTDPDRPSRELSTIVAGRNAWRSCS